MYLVDIYVVSIYIQSTKCLRCKEKKNTESKEVFQTIFLQILLLLDCSCTFVLECLGNNL